MENIYFLIIFLTLQRPKKQAIKYYLTASQPLLKRKLTMPEKFIGILEKLRQAANENYIQLNTDEKLLAAFVLNRCDLLQDMRFSLAEAIERLGISRLEAVPLLSRFLCREAELLSKRYSYAIEVMNEEDGGGFMVRLLDSGIEVESCKFPINGKSVQYSSEMLAYSQAVNTALNWLETMQSQSK